MAYKSSRLPNELGSSDIRFMEQQNRLNRMVAKPGNGSFFVLQQILSLFISVYVIKMHDVSCIKGFYLKLFLESRNYPMNQGKLVLNRDYWVNLKPHVKGLPFPWVSIWGGRNPTNSPAVIRVTSIKTWYFYHYQPVTQRERYSTDLTNWLTHTYNLYIILN